MNESLAGLRDQIDALDEQILTLMNRRASAAEKVAQVKIASGSDGCFYRPEREAEVLLRVQENNPGPLPNKAVGVIFRELMSACLALEKPLNVAFLGPEGTFTQQAAYKHFGHAIQAASFTAIDEIFRAVESNSCRFGVVPIENSTEGVVTHTLDKFLNSPLLICGEVELRIHHNLMSRSTRLSEIDEVFSHQQSLAQCREWLDRFLPGVKRTALSSNGEAARQAELKLGAAAIASEVAAELYGHTILAENIEDEPDNTTRFLIIGGLAVAATGNDRTSLLLSVRNKPGALHLILEPFATHGISMTKIESRPSRRGMWDYVFFIDIEGHRDDPEVIRALAMLESRVSMLKVLGSYPKAVL